MGVVNIWDALAALIEAIARVGNASGDDPDLRVRKRALAVTAAALVPATLVWIPVGFLVDRPLLAWSSLAFSVVLFVSLGLYASSKRFSAFVRTLLVAGLVYVSLGHIALGGFVAGGGGLIWGLLAPISAVLFLDTRESLRWFAVYAALVIGAVILSPVVAELVPGPEVPAPVGLFAYNVLGPAFIVLLLVRYVDGERLTAQTQFQSLLSNVLPASIGERLSKGERIIADYHAETTVLFADLVGFTPLASRSSPQETVLLLNELFSAFDSAAAESGVDKVKTMGDAYLAVAGLSIPRADHARAAVEMAIAMHAQLRTRKRLRDRGLSLRVGIASGPLVAGVIGRQKYAYDVWGDTVNLASRLQTSAKPGEIQVSSATAAAVPDVAWTGRRISVKGFGFVTTFALDANAPASRSPVAASAEDRSSRAEPAAPHGLRERGTRDVPQEALSAS